MIKKNRDTKVTLFILFSVTVVVSNIISAKILWTPFTLFGVKAVLPGSAFVYLLTFMISGLINELWGKDTAKKCVKLGLMSQITALVLFWLTGLLPAQDADFQNAYQTVLGRNFVFVASDMVAGFTAQFANVFLFPFLKNLKPKGNTKIQPKNNGLINCISILISQLFDTIIFMTCAFGIGLGFLLTSEGRLSLLTMFIGQYAIKIIVCFASIPLFNLLTAEAVKKVRDMSPDPEVDRPHFTYFDKVKGKYIVLPGTILPEVKKTIEELYSEDPALQEFLEGTVVEFENKKEASKFTKSKNSRGVFPVLCKECQKYFEQDRKTVEWYKQRGLFVPKRCPGCREARKAKFSADSGENT